MGVMTGETENDGPGVFMILEVGGDETWSDLLHSFGGGIVLLKVGKQFANKIGPDKTQMETNTFVQGLVPWQQVEGKP